MNSIFMCLTLMKEEINSGNGNSKDVAQNVDDVMNSCNLAINILNNLTSEDKLKGGLLSLTKTNNPAFSLIMDAVTPYFVQVS